MINHKFYHPTPIATSDQLTAPVTTYSPRWAIGNQQSKQESWKVVEEGGGGLIDHRINWKLVLIHKCLPRILPEKTGFDVAASLEKMANMKRK